MNDQTNGLVSVICFIDLP